ncbi:PorT family protein [Aequorivita xiaoshiensis]|uniref:PorT family protein n=1 Tax=Aequorivita xiaoshiensis TaxID=2874476 RepID=A0A9X1U418_9FLAO|nr:PorT family protein [Aequorivita xiaoshiensis]MCG2431459.1 PorT family protein [Aequorivita xiaoshiensis]
MKSLITLSTALAIWICSTGFIQAQKNTDWTKNEIEKLNILKENAVKIEKEALKSKIENINKKVSEGSVSETEAENLKKAAAEKHALNIDNRIAIFDNQLALIDRNGMDSTKITGTAIVFGWGQEDVDNDLIFGVKVRKGSRGTVKKYDRRTTSDGYIAVGFNNVATSGESLEDSDFKVAGSRFAELGWTWKTRVFDNSNWLRVRYGLAFQFNGLKPTDNRLFVDTGEQTELQTYPLDLKKSKFRMDNLVIPIHFEFGPSKKIEHENYFRYATRNQFKFGIGGYGGINLGARQKLKFEEDGENQKQKLKADYNTNNFIYGLSTYIGWGATSIYAKYDLNTIFKNNAVDQRNVSLGLRLDLE